ncbi:MAG: UbiD family decarboxylase [Spirochaetaceae bacterium]|nr:MAG: UbiD family decarboxylase [Spirochaetaceae bacterium]
MDQSVRSVLDDFALTADMHVVEKPVDPKFELGAVLQLRERDETQLFTSVIGHSVRVFGNLLNTREKIARGLGVSLDELPSRCIAAVEKGTAVQYVSEAPVQQVVIDSVVELKDLLPVPAWFERESGPYITAGVIIAKHPITRERNVSIARLRLEGGNRIMAGIAPSHHLAQLLRIAGSLNQPLEIAVVIGNHPAVLIGSQMYVELGYDELEIAGSLIGDPIRVVKCKTIDVEVPAEAEIVLEGRLFADQSIEEGPVSEFPGFYVYYGPGHAGEITCMTHRTDPLYHAIVPGYAAEHLLLGGVAIEATTCRALQAVIPSVRRVVITEGGMGRLHAIISMHRPKLGEGKRAVMLAMGQVNLLKLVIVVEDDIDPLDWRQVEWSLAARFNGAEDLMIIHGVKADRCEPQHRDYTVTKIGMIATTRPGDDTPGGNREPARAPQAILDMVRANLNEY